MITATSLVLSLALVPVLQVPDAKPAATAEVREPLPRRGSLGLSFKALPKADAEKHGLKSGEGLVANEPLPGLTAAALGFRAGDMVLRLGGAPVTASTIADVIRSTRAGTQLEFAIVRDGKPETLKGPLLEKPRDPGTDEYEVVYGDVVNAGQRMRTIVTKPRKPGKHPGFMFIQGFSPVSYDYVLSKSTGDVATIDGPLLHTFASSGFVTIRVEKPGVGDSEGGPFNDLDYDDEIGIYKETLAQLKSLPEVDADEVFIFGHSMGSSFGPMIAADDPVKGIAVYGAAARTWFEYLLDTIRYQGLVGGESFEQAHEKVRVGARIMALVMLEKKSPAEVKEAHPDLAPWVDAFFPGGLFNGKSLDFWRQLNDINIASYWNRLDCDVLAVKGASDFVVYETDHKLIADIVNKKSPGKGTFVVAPNCDHLLHAYATEQESLRGFQRGKYSDSFATILKDWIEKVRRG